MCCKNRIAVIKCNIKKKMLNIQHTKNNSFELVINLKFCFKTLACVLFRNYNYSFSFPKEKKMF